MLDLVLTVVGAVGCGLIVLFGIGATWINLCCKEWIDEGIEDENESDNEG